MNKKLIKILPISYFFTATLMNPLTAVDTPIKGVWQTQKEEKNARIDIQDCASDGNKLCGKIIWLESPTYPEEDPRAGQPKLDLNNKEPSLRDRPLMGLELLSDFTKETDVSFKDGKIYNPEDGDVYKCTLELNQEGFLEVRGFVEVLFFSPGKTQLWKRVTNKEGN